MAYFAGDKPKQQQYQRWWRPGRRRRHLRGRRQDDAVPDARGTPAARRSRHSRPPAAVVGNVVPVDLEEEVALVAAGAILRTVGHSH